MFDLPKLQNQLESNIPLMAAMQARIVEVSLEHVALHAPLAPNLNHQGSAFGGSQFALAAGAAWILLSQNLEHHKIQAHIVARTVHAQYKLPITGELQLRCKPRELSDLNQLPVDVVQHHRSELVLDFKLQHQHRDATYLWGEFVVYRDRTQA